MDAFFASVEQRDNPALIGKPVIVGGDPNGRGVVSTASYEARKFGVHSAMPAVTAKRLCPQAIFIKPHFEKYQKASDSIMTILHQHTDLVEPVSIDEAYLDVTENKLKIKDAKIIAKIIKQTIYAATKLTASAGVAPNLFLAKIASDYRKPDGLTIIEKHEVKDFLKDLSVRKIPGVGPVSEAALSKLGIKTCGDILERSRESLIRIFGKFGLLLHERAQGLDEREVTPYTQPKQYSSEETFDRDTRDLLFMKERIKNYSQQVFEGLEASGLAGKTVVLKVKYYDFEVITRSKTFKQFLTNWREVYGAAEELLLTKTLAGKRLIRLLGVGVANLQEPPQSSNFPQDLFKNS